MGNVFKKTVTRPLPIGAEIITRQGVRLACWRDGKGKIESIPLTTGKDGSERIRDESATYVARYRDGNGFVLEVSTGCRDKAAAQSVLADLERRAEKVRSKILTTAEDRMADHLSTAIDPYVAAYATHLEAVGTSPKHHFVSGRSRAGEGIRTPDVQLGKTPIGRGAQRREKPIKRGVCRCLLSVPS
jgi:hypothetical protein